MKSEVNFKELWSKKPYIILDTSSWLELYRLSSTATKDILKLFEDFMDQLWVPHQVYEEYTYTSNNIKKKESRKYQFSNVVQEIEQFKSNFEKKTLILKNRRYPNIDVLEEKFVTLLNNARELLVKFESTLSVEELNEHRHMFDDDPIGSLMKKLKENNKIGSEFTYSELIQIYTEGEMRYTYQIPPGYKDNKKKEKEKSVNGKKETIDIKRKFNDLIIWKQLLLFSLVNKERPIIFLTNDTKSDWWTYDANNNPLRPKDELIKEFKDYNDKSDFVMYTLQQFLDISGIEKQLPLSYLLEVHSNQIRIDQFYKSIDLVPQMWDSIHENINLYLQSQSDFTDLIGPFKDIEYSTPQLWKIDPTSSYTHHSITQLEAQIRFSIPTKILLTNEGIEGENYYFTIEATGSLKTSFKYNPKNTLNDQDISIEIDVWKFVYVLLHPEDTLSDRFTLNEYIKLFEVQP